MSCQWSQFSICSMPLAYPLWIKRSQCPRCRKPSWQPWRTKVFQASNASQRWRSSRRWLDETRIRLGSDSIDCRLPGCDLHASRLDETVHSQEPRTSEKRVPCWTGKIWDGPESGYEGHKVNRKLESLQRNLWTTRQWDQTQRKGDSLALHSPKQSSVVGGNPLRSPGKKKRNPKHIPKQQEGTQHTLKSCECHWRIPQRSEYLDKVVSPAIGYGLPPLPPLPPCLRWTGWLACSTFLTGP